MKKYIFAVVILSIFAGTSFAADASSISKPGYLSPPDRFSGFMPLAGKTPRTTQITVDNTATVLSALIATGGGTYLGGSDNTLTPIAATISCETVDTQWAFTTTPTDTLGHVLAAGASWQPSGPDALALLQGRNSADGASATCAVTLWY